MHSPRSTARSPAEGLDDDAQDGNGLELLGYNPNERELLEYKRRQNTVAARQSRKHKLEYQQHLEDELKRLQGECVRWKEKVALCQEMMKSHGIQPPSSVEEGEEC